MKKLIYSFLFILSLFHFSTAQNKDVQKISITTNNNANSEVWIQIPENPNSYFHQLNTVKWDYLKREYIPDVTISPLDIKGFKLENNVTYVSKVIMYQNQPQWVFLEEILTGEDFTIYAYTTDSKTFTPEILYMLKPDNSLVQIDSECEPYKTYLKEKSLAESKSISQDLDLVKPERYSIKNAYKTYKSDKPIYLKRKNQFGIIAGVNWAKTEIEYLDYSVKTNHPSPLIGIFADIPFSYKEFSFHPELFYIQKKYGYSLNYKEAGDTKVAKRHNLALPLKVRYTNLKNVSSNIRPYIEVGFVTTLVLNNTSVTKVESKNPSKPPQEYRERETNTIYFGATAGVGVETEFIKKYPMHIGFNYMYTNSSKIKTHNFMLSASFTVF